MTTSADQSTGTPQQRDPRVAAEIERIASLFRACGRDNDADAIAQQFRSPPRGKPALFVAGEDKRGKSSLVNALLGDPNVSPIGVEVVTATPITLTYSAQPWAKVFHYGEQQPVEMEPDQARALATVAGNPRNEQNVRSVQLGVDRELLTELNLIDTPGVGGLESGHGTMTLQSLRSADALMFVTEAGAQFRGPELSFLRRASARIDTVILVLTKTDLHRGWRTVLNDDLAILREQAPRFVDCPVVPVSSLLALRALGVDDPDFASELREESGIAKLEQVIRQYVIDRASTLHDVNLLRAGHGGLGGSMLTMRQTLAAASSNSAGRDALEAERARLVQLQQDKARWPQQLDSEIRKLTLERQEQVTRGTVEIKRSYDQRLREIKKHEYDSLPGEFTADLTALAGRLNEVAAERLGGLVDQMLADLDESAKLEESIERITNDNLSDDLSDATLGDFGLTVNDKISLLSSLSTGRSLESLAGAATGALIIPPFGLLLGLGVGAAFAFSNFITRDRTAFTSAFQQWSQAQIQRAQVGLNTAFQRQMIDVQLELREALMNALSAREREVTASLKAAQELQARAASEQQTERARLQKLLLSLRDARSDIEQLLAKLATQTANLAPAASSPAPQSQ